MFTKEVTYTNVADEEVTEKCCFSLSEGEIMDLQLSPKEGLEEHMRKIMEDLDNRRPDVLNFIKELILKAYGVRRELNGHVLFTKTEDDRFIFQYGGAFDAVYSDMLKNPTEIYTFLRTAAPSKYRSRLEEAERNGSLPSVAQIEEDPQKAFEIVKNAENSNS